MEWTQVLVILFSTAGLIIWFRAEARSDYRHMEARTDALLNAIREEIKDFHGRLCAIEEKNKK